MAPGNSEAAELNQVLHAEGPGYNGEAEVEAARAVQCVADLDDQKRNARMMKDPRHCLYTTP